MSRRKLVAIVVAVALVSALAFLIIDLDNDGLNTYQELRLSSDFNNPDTDSDGLKDGLEDEIGTSIHSVDSDADRILDGNTIVLSESDSLCGYLKSKEIYCRVLPNGMYEFYGEQYFSSNPCEYSSGAVYQAKFLSEISQQEFQQLESLGLFDQPSFDSINQAKFLLTIPTSEYQQLESSGKLLDYDTDKDSMDNYFEKTIADLPYDTFNGRCAILVEPSEYYKSADDLYDFLVAEQSFDSERIVKLTYKEATFVNFEKAVYALEEHVDRNSILYVMLTGHGNTGGLCFNDGLGNDRNQGTLVRYEVIGELIDTLKTNYTCISLFTCGGEGALERLKTPQSPCSLATMDSVWIYATSNRFTNLAYGLRMQYECVKIEDYDTNGNGYVSFDESFITQLKSMENFLKEKPEEEFKYGISEKWVASNAYLGDFSVIEQE